MKAFVATLAILAASAKATEVKEDLRANTKITDDKLLNGIYDVNGIYHPPVSFGYTQTQPTDIKNVNLDAKIFNAQDIINFGALPGYGPAPAFGTPLTYSPGAFYSIASDPVPMATYAAADPAILFHAHAVPAAGYAAATPIPVAPYSFTETTAKTETAAQAVAMAIVAKTDQAAVATDAVVAMDAKSANAEIAPVATYTASDSAPKVEAVKAAPVIATNSDIVAKASMADVAIADSSSTIYPKGEPSYVYKYAHEEIAALPYVHQEIPAEPYVHTEIAAEPYVHQEIEAEPYVHQEIAAEPYVHGEIAAEPYVHAEIAAEPYVHADIAAEPYVHSEIAAEPYVHAEIAAEPYVHSEIAAEPYVHAEIAAEPYAHTEIAAEPYVHVEIAPEPYIHTDIAAEPYVHTEIAAVPYIEEVVDAQPSEIASAALAMADATQAVTYEAPSVPVATTKAVIVGATADSAARNDVAMTTEAVIVEADAMETAAESAAKYEAAVATEAVIVEADALEAVADSAAEYEAAVATKAVIVEADPAAATPVFTAPGPVAMPALAFVAHAVHPVTFTQHIPVASTYTHTAHIGTHRHTVDGPIIKAADLEMTQDVAPTTYNFATPSAVTFGSDEHAASWPYWGFLGGLREGPKAIPADQASLAINPEAHGTILWAPWKKH